MEHIVVDNKKISEEIKKLNITKNKLESENDFSGKRTGQGKNYQQIYNINVKLLKLKNIENSIRQQIPQNIPCDDITIYGN